MQHFKNLKELITYFSDEKTCLEYLEQQLWDGKPVCPHCGSSRVYRLANGKQFKCGNKKTCDQKFTVLVGTIYENTKIPLATWFAAIYLLTAHKKGISSCQLARDLGVTQKTAWFINHRIREMVKISNVITLTDTVQIDETYVKGKAKNRTKKKRKMIADGIISDQPAIVFGMVSDKAVMRVVPNAERDSLNPIINEVVQDTQAVIVTDGWTSYTGLDEQYKGHIIVNHAQGEYKVAGYHTNTVEGLWSLLKRGIYGIYHQVSPKHLQRYCEEFAHRYNSRDIKDSERFVRTVQQSKGRLKYADLIKND